MNYACIKLYPEIDISKITSEKDFRNYIKQTIDNSNERDWIIGDQRGKLIFSILQDYVDCENSIVLDVGCGFGGISLFLSRKTNEVLSLDIDRKLIKITNKRGNVEGINNIYTLLGSATNVPLKNESLDLVLIIGVLEWIPLSDPGCNPKDLQLRTLNEAWRILRKKGKLLLAIENRYYLGYWLGRKDHHSSLRFVPIFPRWFANFISKTVKGKPYLNWTYSYPELLSMLEKTGFKVLKVFIGLPSYTLPREIADIRNKKEIKTKLDLANLKNLNLNIWKLINNLGLIKIFGSNFICLCSK